MFDVIGKRMWQIARVYVPLTVIAGAMWSGWSVHPDCAFDYGSTPKCQYAKYTMDNGFFASEALLAGLMIVAGVVSAVFLARRLRAWGLMWQIVAALMAIGLTFAMVKVEMWLNPVIVSVDLSGDEMAAQGLDLRSATQYWLWALVVQMAVIFVPVKSEAVDSADSVQTEGSPSGL